MLTRFNFKNFISSLSRHNTANGKTEQQKNRIVSYARRSKNIKSNFVRFRPDNFEKYAIIITNHLLNHQAAIVDYSRLDNIYRQRLIDFICGAVYCLGGTINKLADKLYLITPSSVTFKGEEDIADDSISDKNKLIREQPKRMMMMFRRSNNLSNRIK